MIPHYEVDSLKTLVELGMVVVTGACLLLGEAQNLPGNPESVCPGKK